MSAGQDSGEDKEELAERERVITARKEKIESQMEAITSSRQPAKRLSPDEMAKLRKDAPNVLLGKLTVAPVGRTT